MAESTAKWGALAGVPKRLVGRMRERIRTRPSGSRPSGSTAFLCAVVLVMVVVALIGYAAMRWDADRRRADLANEVSILLEISHIEMTSRAGEHQAIAIAWAASEAVREATESLVAVGGPLVAEFGGDTCGNLLPGLRQVVTAGAYSGFGLVGRNGVVLCADQPEKVGRPHPIFGQNGQFELVAAGDPLHIDRWEGVALVHEVAAPVSDDAGDVSAALVISFDPNSKSSSLPGVNSFRRSGEVYAFDGRGFLISDTRFFKRLDPATGHVAVAEVPRLAGDQFAAGGAHTDMPARVLPRFGADDSQKNVTYGTNFDSYLDYRETEVVGAWLWDPHLGLGIVAEIDKTEAAEVVRATWAVGLWALAAAEVLIGALALVLMRLKRSVVRSDAAATRHRNTFDGAPVALWEEDFSAVATWLRSLPGGSSPTELRSFLWDNPDVLDHGISLIRVSSINPVAASMIDLDTGKSLFGGDPADSITAEVRSAVIEQFLAMARGQTAVEVDISGNTRGGETMDGILYWQAATLENGEADYSTVLVAIVDISKRALAERRLRETIRSKDRLIASISHELRTPLTGVLGFAELLQDPQNTLSASERAEMLSSVAAQAEDISFIVEDLLVAARFESSSLEVSSAPLSIDTEVARVVGQLRTPESRPIDAAVGSLRAMGDAARVRQVLRNLITNAIRYGGEQIRITTREDEEVVAVQVIDNGEGVPGGDRDRIFEPFERAQDEVGRPGAIGLGLSISRQLSRLMGGDLTYHRDDSETIFELTLPALVANRSDSASEIPAQQTRV